MLTNKERNFMLAAFKAGVAAGQADVENGYGYLETTKAFNDWLNPIVNDDSNDAASLFMRLCFDVKTKG